MLSENIATEALFLYQVDLPKADACVTKPIHKSGAELNKLTDAPLGFAGGSVAAEPFTRNGLHESKASLPDVNQALAALRAFAAMARISQRHQAEVDAALHRVGMALDPKTRLSVLRYLTKEGCIDGQIPLSDGALILTVTAVGMSRAGLG